MLPLQPPAEALAAFGWSERVAALAAEELARHPGDQVGRVARIDRGTATVVTGAGTTRAATTEPTTTGDWVLLAADGGRVRSVLPRWSALVRRAADRDEPQLLAANVDLVLLALGCDRPLNVRRLERLLAVAWESGARPAVVLTKADVVGRATAPREDVAAVALGVEVLVTSAHRGEGLEDLRAQVGAGETAVLLGESGAGKSTLVNALTGGDRQAVGAVRGGDAKGRHTTTVRELVPIGNGAVLLDTPGLRSVGLWGNEEGIERTFADITALAAGCRFRDCAHEEEPGCAVTAAAAEGTLDPARLAAYHQLVAELGHAQRQADARLRRESERAWGRMQRAAVQAKQDRREGRR